MHITLAIPTYNGATRLPILLEKLQSQINVDHLKWEIIIVDNNSKDNTAEVVHHYQKNWKYNYNLKYFLETKQGAAFARLRAIKEASGEFIAFLDDDNLPETDWLYQAYKFGISHPYAGAWSGQIHGAYETPPPEEFERIQAFLAIREHGDKPHLFEAENLRLPPAAALIIRKKAWLESVPPIPSLAGKLPGLFVQGDDYEPLLYIHKRGWQIWYHPQLHTYHQIPAWRLEKDYLFSLARACGLCICELRLINAKPQEKLPLFFRIFIGNFKRILNHLIKYRGELRHNLIASFEVQFYLGSMVSPLFSVVCYFRKILGKPKIINLTKTTSCASCISNYTSF
jgi:glycosyltransferase involved in cell wall biosynthesis